LLAVIDAAAGKLGEEARIEAARRVGFEGLELRGEWAHAGCC
jgi:hypothetical protein